MAHMPSTNWSLVRAARSPDLMRRAVALGDLLERYSPALRTHLVCRFRGSALDAEDLVQGFIADKILDRDLLAGADAASGRFRSLLLRSLENYAIDQIRRLRTQETKRTSWDQTESEDNDERFAEDQALVDPFDVAWARQVLEQAMARMRQQCLDEDQEVRWLIFNLRVIQPLWNGTPEPGGEQLMQQFGYTSPRQASNTLITAKRHFRRVLEEIIAEYLCDGETVADELNQLASIVAHAGPLRFSFSKSGSSSLSPGSADWLPGNESPNSVIDPSLWQKLLGVDDLPTSPWSAAELTAMWRDQSATRAPDTSATIGALLLEPTSSVEELSQLKDIARNWVREKQESIPTEIAWAVYFSAIAAAYVRHQARISQLNDDVLREGFRTLSAAAWLDAATRKLFAAGYSRLIKPECGNAVFDDTDAQQRREKLARLTDEHMRRVGELKLQGLSHQEIADILGCSLRTVERTWSLIRQLWRT